MTEQILAVIPLPMDVQTVGRVLGALAREFAGASVRDGEHSGTYIPRTGAGLPVRTMEVLVEEDQTDEAEAHFDVR